MLASGGGTFAGHSLFGAVNLSDRDGRRHDPSRRKSGSLRWSTLTGDGALFNYQDVDFVPGWQLSYNPVVWLWGEKSGGLRTQLRHDLAPMRMRLTFGVDADYTEGNRREPRITPVEQDGMWIGWSLTTQPPDYDYAFTYRGVAGYGQMELSPMSRLRVTTGIRVDTAGYDYDNHLSVVQTGVARRPADAERTFTQASPKFGATYVLTPAVTITGSYRRGFRVPTEAHLFKQGSSANTNPLIWFGVLVLLAAACAVACYVPARRASTVDPIAVLKQG